MKDIDEYADFTNVVWKDPKDDSFSNEIAILSLGLAGEAGEVVEKIKKLLHYDRQLIDEDMVKELGDVVFYWVRLCRMIGFHPSEVLQANVDKLTARMEKDTVWGEGSDR